MFRLHRHKSEKSGERVDFKFSQFQAVPVPKGWDKLFVSIISVETGKTIAKSSKASVRSGNCQWTETLSESVWVSQDDASKEFEECLFKLVVSMGSARSGILGEAIVNLTNYMSSRTSIPVSLPLKKCNHGTTLQVKIQCLNPRITTRDEQRKGTSLEDMNLDHDELDKKSDVSDNSYARSVGSSSSNHLSITSHPGELGSRNTSFSASGSRHSSDSAEGFVDRTNFSPRNNLNGDLYNPIGRQDSSGSQNSAPFGIPVEDHSRSNHSSFNSKFTGSGSNFQKQRQEVGQNSSHLFARSPLKNAGSSKDLLEAAEDTIEELRTEAKTWERNARKLMVDLEILRKEFTDQSRHQADLDMELSAACIERDGLKQEIKQLNILLEESKVKQITSENLKLQEEGITHILKELESEIRFQKESNDNLTLQLEKAQESNIELVSVLQELEETIEKQRLEIDNFSAEKTKSSAAENYGQGNENTGSLEAENNWKLELQLQELEDSQKELQATVHLLEKTLEDKNQELEHERAQRNQIMLNIEAEWTSKLSKKDDEILKLDAKLSDLLNTKCSQEMRSSIQGNLDLIKEIENLKEKVQELERDCNELTEENLELIFKLKESEKDLLMGGTSFNSSSNELRVNVSASTSESEAKLLKSQINQLEQELMKKEILCEGIATENLHVQVRDLHDKCTDLELQLQSCQSRACDLDSQLCNSQFELGERETEITELKQQLESYQGKETRFQEFESLISLEMSKIFSELYKQLQLTLAHVKKPWYYISCPINSECENGLDDSVGLNSTVTMTQKEQADAILNNVLELNNLLQAKIVEHEAVFKQSEVEHGKRAENVVEAQKNLGDCSLTENTPYLSIQGLESLKMELEAKVADLNKELVANRFEIQELEASLSSKEEEVEVLRHSQTELEAQISSLQKEKGQLEENLEIVSRESSITSKCLDDVQNDLIVLNSNLDSHVSANKMLERKTSELESGKLELEIHLSELEEENVQLSERISGMEAQLRYLTNEKESSRLDLENSKSVAMDLRNEIERLGNEMETQKYDLKQKLQDMQKRWSEAQEECEYLKRANPKLQATAESLIDECTSVQKLNGELRKQKLELHEHCTHLEAELRESRKSLSDCCKNIELLEKRMSSMQEDVASKEKFLTSELDTLLHEHKEHKEKLIQGENLLSQMYMEKMVEVENLQREVAHLTEQISATHDERERIASNAVLETSSLRADKAKLERALQEAQAKVKSSETELHTLQLESENKVQGLINELAASKQNHELLIADHEKLQRLMDDVKSSEEKFKSTVNGLELKLRASEYERQQLMEEIGSLKVQLQKVAQLQDEVLALKNSLSETKYENGKLEASLQLLSGDCEELKAERISFVEKISNMQKSISELEDCKHSRVVLEEKLLRLEGDLTAKEALCAQDAELKNELSRIKRSNSQFQRKVQCLEEEKDECLNRVKTLEEELKLKMEGFKFLETKMEKNDNQDDEIKRTAMKIDQLQEFSSGQQNLDANQYQREGDNKHNDHNGRPQVVGVDLMSKIQLLENELAEALEANSMYKVQLKKFLTDEHNGHANAPKKLTSKGEVVKTEGCECDTSSLEAELRDIRERYFHMSLKFAEVEAQREELVMQIKTLKNGKRWFS